MKPFAIYPVLNTGLWSAMAATAVLLFFLTVTVIALLLRQKQYWGLPPALLVALLLYFMEQCIVTALDDCAKTAGVQRIIRWFVDLPDGLLLAALAASGAVLGILAVFIRRKARSSITNMSVKAATDNLPDGLCCYLPGGRILLANRAMEAFCDQVTGSVLLDGEAFTERLQNGLLQPGCRTVTVGEDLVVLTNDAARKIVRREIPFEGGRAQMLLALDITDAYRRSEELREMQQRVRSLNDHLVRVNRQIVGLTVEQEVMNAKVRLHDELGSDLLLIKRCCREGGTEQETAELIRRLRRNVSFLKTAPAEERDEYELLFEIARRMGLTIAVTGVLPQTDPQKHIVATAIHECATNTLRHAHGTELYVHAAEDGAAYSIDFTNNGEPPAGKVAETGGLASLRVLTEQTGGEMTIQTQPAFSIRLTLPKEANHGL